MALVFDPRLFFTTSSLPSILTCTYSSRRLLFFVFGGSSLYSIISAPLAIQFAFCISPAEHEDSMRLALWVANSTVLLAGIGGGWMCTARVSIDGMAGDAGRELAAAMRWSRWYWSVACSSVDVDWSTSVAVEMPLKQVSSSSREEVPFGPAEGATQQQHDGSMSWSSSSWSSIGTAPAVGVLAEDFRERLDFRRRELLPLPLLSPFRWRRCRKTHQLN